MSSFNLAQTFYLDKTTVQNADTVSITGVDLYFKNKPNATNNNSGLLAPGVTIYITETVYSVPKIERSKLYTTARLEYADISASSDATVASRFRFSTPVSVKTNAEYAIIVKFDRNESFTLWNSKQADFLVGTTQRSSGPTGKFVGNYYEYTSLSPLPINNTDSNYNLEEYASNWTPLSDTDLKFKVYCARYFQNGSPVVANTDLTLNTPLISNRSGAVSANGSVQFDLPTNRIEYVIFDQDLSTKEVFVGGQKVFQNTVFYPGGPSAVTISTVAGNNIVTANTLLPNGSSFNWNTIFPSLSGEKYVVLHDTTKVNVRRVKAIVNTSVIEIYEPASFSNNLAKMMITPVGVVDSFNKASPFGVSESFLMISSSSANATVRFVNNAVEAVSITAGGTGYKNTDVFYIKGFENVTGIVEGGYVAIGNVGTNSTGGITSISFSNLGCGFVNTSAMVAVLANTTQVGNTTANTSAGSGATFSYTVGSTIRTDQRPNVFRKCKVVNLDLGQMLPYFQIDLPAGTTYDMSIQTQYFQIDSANTLGGKEFYVESDPSSTLFSVQMFKRGYFHDLPKTPVYLSRSNEFITKYANGSVNDKVSETQLSSNSIMLVIDSTSNNDFVSASLKTSPVVNFSKFIINNDYTNEHTDSGNSWVRSISKKIPFTRLAEDVRVYATVYKPANTDIRVFARIHNSGDPEPFDDKEWTLLAQTDGIGLRSSTTNKEDYIECGYGLPQYPNVSLTFTGTATTQLSNAVVTGSGTTWSTNATANLVAGDLVRVYSPLFPNNHIVAVVNSVANNTQITLDNAIANSGLVGSGMMVDKVGYKYQTYNNIQNSNVCRYYNGSMVPFDGYDTMTLKIILLSDTPHKIPRVDDVTATGVTA